MRNCEFVNNTANEKKSTSEVGNLIYLDLKDQQGIISGTFFENNNVYQGCIYVKSSDFNQGLEIAGSVFINNTGVFREAVCMLIQVPAATILLQFHLLYLLIILHSLEVLLLL